MILEQDSKKQTEQKAGSQGPTVARSTIPSTQESLAFSRDNFLAMDISKDTEGLLIGLYLNLF